MNESTQYLTFEIGKDRYALPLLRVHGIVEQTLVTPVPGSASFVKGVFNHGGVITPVIDLGARLGLGHTAAGRRACFILVGAAYEGEELPIGLLVDGVTNVCEISTSDVQPAPDFGNRIKLDYLAGLARSEDGFTVMFDVDGFLTADEVLAMREHVRGEDN